MSITVWNVHCVQAGVQPFDEQRRKHDGHSHAGTELREQILLELAKRDTSDLAATCRAVTEAAAALVGVARASVWRFSGDQLVCDDLFLRDESRHTSGQVIPMSSCPTYFAYISRSMALRARDAHTDPRTMELEASYLGPLGIGAMLDTPIWVPGAVGGVLCCEHVGGPRRWTGREERDAGRMADLVSRSIETSTRRAAEERSKIILESIPQYILVADENGVIVETSALAKHTLAREGGTSMADRFDTLELRNLAGELIPPAQWPTERSRRGETVRGEIVEISSLVTGQRRWMRATSAPVRIGESARGAVVIFEDIAEEIRIERVKREFLAAVSHELRTPTMIVKGFAQRLRKISILSGDERRALDAMDRAARRIERLTEALVDFSAVTLGRIVLSLEHVDLSDLALQAIKMTPGATTHSVHFAPSEPAARVFVDPLRVRRVICELIENAAHCSAPASEIDVEVRVEGAAAQVRIRDHGVGIPHAARARIFEPFYHAHMGSPNDVGGLGIGLFLAREIVNRHGGSIAFETTEGAGTTFIVTLPLDAEEAP